MSERTRPLVSVVIPTWNRPEVTKRAIRSVQRQTYEPIEIIVVDDGSTDQTPDVLASYGDAIRAIRQENAGPSAARNRGAREARGEVFSFLDSDDEWLETKVERQVDALARAGDRASCCLTDSLVKSPSGAEASAFRIGDMTPPLDSGIWLNPAEVLATRFVLFAQVVAVRREAWDEVGGFDEGLRLLEDFDLSLRLALRPPWAYLSDPLVVRHYSPESLSEAADAVRIQTSMSSVCRKVLGGEPPLDDRVRRLLEQRLRQSELLLSAAKRKARGGLTGRLFAGMVELMIRGQKSVRRRSPGYPRMRVEPLPSGV